MPTLKTDIDNFSDEEEEEPLVHYDCDGMPYIASMTDFNLKSHFQEKWANQQYEHVQHMWKFIQDYTIENGLPMLENAKYIDFLRFVAHFSYKFPSEYE
tara:strand:- start:681 stop:977 length:297 start_codon:yes stop_codon:yes gene_type:complete